MKAKCFKCDGLDKNCKTCKGTGFLEVTIATGLEWDLVCEGCNQIIGFHIQMDGEPEPPEYEDCADCFDCPDGTKIKYKFTGNRNDNDTI